MALSFRRLLLLGVLALALHNGEEALTMPGWLETRFAAVTQELGLPAIQPPRVERLYSGLAAVTVVPGLLIVLGARGGPGSLGVYGCLFFCAILFWNALVPHVTSAVLLREYTPGVLTAALVNLPYSVHVFARALREGQVARTGLLLVLCLAAVLYPLGMLLLWAPGGRG